MHNLLYTYNMHNVKHYVYPTVYLTERSLKAFKIKQTFSAEIKETVVFNL